MRGILYAGLVLAAEGPQTLEFNARFGDPEVEALLPLLDANLVDLMLATTAASVAVVRAAAGHPGAYRRGCRSPA